MMMSLHVKDTRAVTWNHGIPEWWWNGGVLDLQTSGLLE